MSSLFRSTKNTRALPTGTLHYIRSDVPENLSDAEIAWLAKNNITTVIDLRSIDEVIKHPCCLSYLDGFDYIHLPVTGGNEVPKSFEHLHSIYEHMIDAQMDKIIDTIINARTNVIYFCTAGKDRTGVVSALILKKLGFCDKDIIDDYMISKDNLADMLGSYAKNADVDIDIITPRKENIEHILNKLH